MIAVDPNGIRTLTVRVPGLALRSIFSDSVTVRLLPAGRPATVIDFGPVAFRALGTVAVAVVATSRPVVAFFSVNAGHRRGVTDRPEHLALRLAERSDPLGEEAGPRRGIVCLQQAS